MHRECGDVNVASGRAPTQLGWYRFASSRAIGQTVIDIGCGLGHGLEILRGSASCVTGQDVDPRLARDGVVVAPLESLPSKSYDIVTAIDVIEHIPDDASFVAHLTRIARRGVFVSTPNWTLTRCQWPYHVREYTRAQLKSLWQSFGSVELVKGSPSGEHVYPVRYFNAFNTLNVAWSNHLTRFPTRIWNRLIPPPLRLWSHIGCWVTLP